MTGPQRACPACDAALPPTSGNVPIVARNWCSVEIRSAGRFFPKDASFCFSCGRSNTTSQAVGDDEESPLATAPAARPQRRRGSRGSQRATNGDAACRIAGQC